MFSKVFLVTALTLGVYSQHASALSWFDDPPADVVSSTTTTTITTTLNGVVSTVVVPVINCGSGPCGQIQTGCSSCGGTSLALFPEGKYVFKEAVCEDSSVPPLATAVLDEMYIQGGYADFKMEVMNPDGDKQDAHMKAQIEASGSNMRLFNKKLFSDECKTEGCELAPQPDSVASYQWSDPYLYIFIHDSNKCPGVKKIYRETWKYKGH